ncbi:MAG: sodium:proline symporter, partial [Pseudomonadota bacterium]|nr:sodium:proline symporter [Pseudomonadota bacterium]
MTATTAAFTLYRAPLFVLARAAWRKTRNETDYVLGGRSLGPAVAALSAGASDMSGWLLLGLPGAVFLGGLTESWIMIGLMLGAYLNWRFVAARLREATGTGDGQGGALTLPAFFAQRAEGSPRSRRAVRALATILILFFFTFYVSAGLVAGA